MVTAAGYRVDPSGVQSVLNDVAQSGEAIAGALKPLQATMTSSASAADGMDGGTMCTVGVPSAGLISAALAAFADEISSRLGVIVDRVPAATGGLHDAAQAVISGDAEMAAEVQSSMISMMNPGAAFVGTRAR